MTRAARQPLRRGPRSGLRLRRHSGYAGDAFGVTREVHRWGKSSPMVTWHGVFSRASVTRDDTCALSAIPVIAAFATVAGRTAAVMVTSGAARPHRGQLRPIVQSMSLKYMPQAVTKRAHRDP